MSRRQLAAARVPRWLVRAELRARRWQAYGQQVVLTHNGPVPLEAVRWAAVLSVGCRAALDGVTALQLAGARGLDDTVPHVITPKGSTPHRPRWLVLHESRRYRAQDVLAAGLPRTRPAVAAVHAALWARTEREATYLLVLAVQQRLATPAALREVLDTVRRHRFRRALLDVVADLAGGVHSLGELDVARDVRRRGLPEPSRQSVRRRASGTQYLDVEWPAYGVALEVDGAGHEELGQRLDDLLRDLDLLAEGTLVVRVPLVVYRRDRERVLDALGRLLVARGWVAAA